MKNREKHIFNCVVFALIIAEIIISVVRVCTNTTQNTALGIAGKFDDNVRMTGGDSIEFEGEAVVSGLTGFGFRFMGNREYFEDAGFLISATVQNDTSDPQPIYMKELALIDQAYDYKNENYIIIIPFERDVQKGDKLSITVTGMGISKEAGVYVRSGGVLYCQIRGVNAFPILMQGIIVILLILLAGELLKEKKEKASLRISTAEKCPLSLKKQLIKLLPVVIFLVAALEYTCYAGIRMQRESVTLSRNMLLLFLAFSSLVIGLSLVVFICGQNKMKLEKMLFLTILCLGILFELVITPFAAPDEAAHIDTAYRISNDILRIEDTGIRDAIYKRECDIYTDSGIKRTISDETYQWLYNDWSMRERDVGQRLIFAADGRKNANSLFYLPAAVCMSVGRILGIGFVPMILLARTANLLLAAWLIYLAVKKIPFGKSILCMTALLPITLQEIASCTYDALIIPISMLYVSYCVFAIYSEEKIEKKDILIIIITAFLIGTCKGGVYAPMYLLLIWALGKKGYIRFAKKKRVSTSLISVIAVVILTGLIGVVTIYLRPVDPTSLSNGHYSLTYLIQHPLETFRIIENSLYKDTYYYFEQLFGKAMGSFQISIKFIVPIGYIILMGKSVIRSEKYPYVPNVMDKCVYMTTAALVFAAVQAAFLFAITDFGSRSIGGIQGRYFLPVVWVFLICFRRESVTDKNKNYTGLVLAGYLLGICTVLQIVISAFNPNI